MSVYTLDNNPFLKKLRNQISFPTADFADIIQRDNWFFDFIGHNIHIMVYNKPYINYQYLSTVNIINGTFSENSSLKYSQIENYRALTDIYTFTSVGPHSLAFSPDLKTLLIHNSEEKMKSRYIRSATDTSISVFEMFDSRFAPENKKFNRSFSFKLAKSDFKKLAIVRVKEFFKSQLQSIETLENQYTDYENEGPQNSIVIGWSGLLNNTAFVAACYLSDAYESVGLTMISEQDCECIEKQILDIFADLRNVSESGEGNFFMIEKDPFSGFTLKEFNIESKYNDGFIETHFNDDFKSISEEIISLVSNDGRGIVLLHGTPGTGKTNFIKYLATKEKKRKLVYLPTYMIPSLTDPSFLGFLSSELAGCVLVFEDAESAITSRESNSSDSNAVSTILNITDGLLGESLKVLVICSFNTDLQYIDTALTRAGRMKVRYEFNALTADKADKLLNSLDKPEQGKPLTVADVYNTITEVKNAQPRVKFGFGQ